MSSAIKTPAFAAKASNIQNEDGSSIYSGGEWSFKNASAVTGFHVASDGKVGIGTTSPACKLHVESDKIIAGTVNSPVGSTILEGKYANGALTVFGSEASSGGAVMSYSCAPKPYGGNIGTFVSSTGITSTRSAYVVASDHRWYTGSSSSTAIGDDVSVDTRMHLRTNGCLYTYAYTGISLSSFGTTGSNLWNDASKVTLKLASFNNCMSIIVGSTINDRNANIQVGHESTAYATTVGSLWLNRLGGTVYANTTAISDKRYKRDLEKVTNALDKINELSGYTYYRTDIEKDLKKAGVVAQEVQKVLPEAVVYNETDDMYGVSYHMLSALYIEAIKELTDKNKELEARLAALESK